ATWRPGPTPTAPRSRRGRSTTTCRSTDTGGIGMELDGRVAIVSGGGTGIGAATARLFAYEGASVVVTGRRPGPIEAVATEISGVPVAGENSDPAHRCDAAATV